MSISLTKTAIATSLVLFSVVAPLASAATVTVPNNIEISSVDGHAVNAPSKINVAPGEHLIALKYNDYFNMSADEAGDWVNSNTLFAKINVTSQNQITLSTPVINDVADAQAFVQQPQLFAKDGQGARQTIALQSESALLTNLLENH